MEQITLNFDASEFDGYNTTQEYFAHASRILRDDAGRIVQGQVQAMQMDYSPSHWSQKINKLNNASITLDDADRHTEIYGDVSWIYYLIHRHIIKKRKNLSDLLAARDEINRQIALQSEGAN